ncbi:MAG: amidase [Halioglobus sp.]|jgi:amidase
MLSRGEVKGPLHGIPFTLKDSIDTAGLVSTTGTLGRKNYILKSDATVAIRLRSAGVILLGETNTPELTLFNDTNNRIYGRTFNPYDNAVTVGGGAVVAQPQLLHAEHPRLI